MAHNKSNEHNPQHGSGNSNLKAAAGTERNEPGKPTREIHADEHATKGAAHDIEEIASQQGASQRGYTADGKDADKKRPAQFDPKHPGGRPEGDPRR